MTFEELSNTLPNGFHDATLQRFEMDYMSRILVLDVVMFIGELDDPSRRELYRPARVTVENVAYLVIDPPDPLYAFAKPGDLQIDTGEGVPASHDCQLPEPPLGTTLTWMYIADFNRCLYFAGGDSQIEWTEPEENRT